MKKIEKFFLRVLGPARIKPYALEGSSFDIIGLLLRSDVHKLFDTGYLTITDHKVEVSKRIRKNSKTVKSITCFMEKCYCIAKGRKRKA